LEPKSLNKEEREDTSIALPSVWASVEVAATGAGAGVTGASVLGVLGALAALEAGAGAASLEGVAAGTGVGAEAVEEVFLAIL